MFSVALSVGLPRLGVTQRPALWSPDFPRKGTLPFATVFSSPQAYYTGKIVESIRKEEVFLHRGLDNSNIPNSILGGNFRPDLQEES